EGGEKHRYRGSAGSTLHAADRVDDRIEVAADLVLGLQPEACQVDHHHGRPVAETDAPAPAAAQVAFAQIVQMRQQRAAQRIGQPELSRGVNPGVLGSVHGKTARGMRAERGLGSFWEALAVEINDFATNLLAVTSLSVSGYE